MRPAKNQNIPCAAAQGLYWAAIAAFMAFIFAFLLHTGYSDVQVGWVATLMYLANTVTGPLTGYVADTFLPARRLIPLCFALSLPFMVTLYFVREYFWAAAACIVLVSVFQSMLGGVLDSWIVRIRDRHPEVSYPTARSFGSAFYSLTALAVGRLIVVFGYPVMFVSSLLLSLAFMAAVQFMEHVPCENRERSPAEGAGTRSNFLHAFGALLRCRDYMIYMASMVLYVFGVQLLTQFQPSLLFRIGGTAADVGACNAVSAMLEIPMILLLSRYLRLQRKGICLVALIIGAGKGLTMFLFPTVNAYLAAQVFQAVSYGYMIVFTVQYIRQKTPPALYSTALMVYMTVNKGICGVLASLSGGYIIEYDPNLLMLLSVLLMTASAGVFSLTYIRKGMRGFFEKKPGKKLH